MLTVLALKKGDIINVFISDEFRTKQYIVLLSDMNYNWDKNHFKLQKRKTIIH